MSESPNIVLWGDGAGSTARSIIDAVHDGKVNFNVTGIITTKANAGILQHAKNAQDEHGMDIAILIVKGQPGKRQTEAEQIKILQFMTARGAHTLVLVGALVIMGKLLVGELNGEIPEESYPKTLAAAQAIMIPNKDGFSYWLPKSFLNSSIKEPRFGLLNSHPAPTIVTANTWGVRAQRRLVDLRSRQGGHTLHVVGYDIDTGPTIAAHVFEINPLRPEASERAIQTAAVKIFKQAQTVEKANLAQDIDKYVQARRNYLAKQSTS